MIPLLPEDRRNCVSFVERLKIGHIEDGYNMALALYNALQGLKKMAQCINISGEYADFAEISIEDIDQMFNYLEKITVRMNDQNTRRAMQD